MATHDDPPAAERRPTWVYGVGHEPDPRFSLANERTFLAWVRTALGLLGGAIALNSLGVPDLLWLRTTLVVVLVVLVVVGGAMTALALRRWALIERAMRESRPLPAFGLGIVLTVAVVLVSALLAVTFLVT